MAQDGICIPCLAAVKSSSVGKIAQTKELAIAAAQRQGHRKAYITRNEARADFTGYGYSFEYPADGFAIVEVVFV